MAATPEFDAALKDFKKTLDPKELAQFHVTKLDDVKAEIGRIERVHEQDRLQRGLRRIDPFIQGLQRYAGVIETFVQAKPEILALIWGPIKFILEATHRALNVFDTILNAFRDIGECLPRFETFGNTLKSSPRVEHVLVLVYKNILVFYAQVLEVMRKKKWKQFFDLFWTSRSTRLAQLLENIRHSRDLVDIEASAASIASAHLFFSEARDRFKEESTSRKSRMFQAAETWLDPLSFNEDFDRFDQVLDASKGSGTWLMSHPDFRKWEDSSTSNDVLWLTGIPGSGKTVLAYHAWSHIDMKAPNKPDKETALALFVNDEQNTTGQGALSAVTVLRTIAFQLLSADQDSLLPILTAFIEKAGRKIQGKGRKSAESLVDELFAATDMTQVILCLDGLDEMTAKERAHLLSYILLLRDKSAQMSVSLKLLISCRSVPDVKSKLALHPTIEVHKHNAQDISNFAATARIDLQIKYRISEQESTAFLQDVSSRSEGMFLYCRLMMHALKHQPSRAKLELAAKSLPKGLQAAYSRILQDILNLEEHDRDIAITILQLLVCAKGRPRVVQIQRIVEIEAGDSGFHPDKFLLTEIEDLFGPLLEVRNERLHFVHFSAKEFLETKESSIEIQRLNSHYNMAVRNITYLNFDCFRPTLADSEIAHHLLNGDYLWVRYARQNWLHHASIGSRVKSLDTSVLYDGLNCFYEHWWNPQDESWKNASAIAAQGASILEGLHEASHDLRLRLGLTFFFDSQLRNTSKTEDFYPLTIDSFLLRVWETLEKLITDPSYTSNQHDSLRTLYGSDFYFCRERRCPRYAGGFRSQAERDQHSLIHDMSYKCKRLDCEHSRWGFFTHDELQVHERTHEIDSVVRGVQNLRPFVDLESGNGTTGAAWSMIQDAIANSDFARVEHLMQKYHTRSALDILHEATRQGALDIMSCMLGNKGVDINGCNDGTSALCHARTVETVQFLLDRGANPNLHLKLRCTVFTYVIGITPFSENIVATIMDHELDPRKLFQLDEIEKLWSTTPFDMAARKRNAARLLSMATDRGVTLNENTAQKLLWSEVFQIEPDLIPHLLHCGPKIVLKDESALTPAAKAKDPWRMKAILKQGNLNEKHLEVALVVACSSPFEEGVSLLLDHGVNPNAPHCDKSPLLEAARVPSPKSARIIKILIEAGAKVESVGTSSKHEKLRRLRDYQVIKCFESYVGITFEELLRTRDASREAANPSITSLDDENVLSSHQAPKGQAKPSPV